MGPPTGQLDRRDRRPARSPAERRLLVALGLVVACVAVPCLALAAAMLRDGDGPGHRDTKTWLGSVWPDRTASRSDETIVFLHLYEDRTRGIAVARETNARPPDMGGRDADTVPIPDGLHIGPAVMLVTWPETSGIITPWGTTHEHRLVVLDVTNTDMLDLGQLIDPRRAAVAAELRRLRGTHSPPHDLSKRWIDAFEHDEPLRTINPALLALDTAAVTAVVALPSLVVIAVGLVPAARRARRFRRGLCPRCRYDLSAFATPPNRCPECGVDLAPNRRCDHRNDSSPPL